MILCRMAVVDPERNFPRGALISIKDFIRSQTVMDIKLTTHKLGLYSGLCDQFCLMKLIHVAESHELKKGPTKGKSRTPKLRSCTGMSFF